MFELISSEFVSGKLVFLAAAIQATALLFRGQIKIRILLLIGSMVYLIYYMIAAKEPLWEAMIATCAMSIANIYGLGSILLRNRVKFIPADQHALYSMFCGVEPGEFRTLMKYGHIRKLQHEEFLTITGKVPDNLFFIIEGEIEIEKDNTRFSISPRHFIGEVSLMLGSAASASVSLKAGSKIVEWSREKLLHDMAHNVQLKSAIETLLSRDMAKKVAIGTGREDVLVF